MAPSSPSRRRYRVRLATSEDDAALRALWRDTPMPGGVALTFAREPEARLALALTGDEHATIVVRHGDAVVAAMTRSLTTAFVNGAPRRLGYLSGLRLHPEHRSARVLLDAVAAVAALHAQGDVRLYVTTVFADNVRARRLLERGHQRLPRYEPLGRLTTFVLPVLGRRARWPEGVRVARADDQAPLLALLRRSNARYQFSPAWTAETLCDGERGRGLRLEDFVVVERGGELVGCAAVWDQRAFKQTLVQGYHGPMRLVRPLWNAAATLLGGPVLPRPGDELAHAYLSHLGLYDEDPELLTLLVRAALARGRERGVSQLTFMLPHEHALATTVRRRFLQLGEDVVLYAVDFGDGAAELAALDGRPALLEAAVL